MLLTVILIHLIGFYVYFVVRLDQIRSEMRENIAFLPPNEFEVFELTFEEYDRVRMDDHEVKINGRMYDHATPRIENGMVILYAKHDAAEDNLLSLVEEIVKTASGDTKEVPTELTTFFHLDCIPQGSLTINSTLTTRDCTSHPNEKLLSEKLPVESPPPKANLKA